MQTLTAKLDVESILWELEDLSKRAEDTKLQSFLTSVMAEICEEHDICPICLERPMMAVWGDRRLTKSCACSEHVVTYQY